MRRFFIRGTAVLLLLILTVSMLCINASAVSDGEVTLTIIHINDRHGRMDADPYISQLAKETAGNVLILDAGDALHGQPTANLTKGAAMTELMNAVGYSAMVTGNHEFNYGVERLLELSEMMEFPLLAANIKDSGGNYLFQTHAIFPMNGLTVGVFGLATPETIEVSDPRIMAGLTFEDPATVAKAMVDTLKSEKCDIIIALTHMGTDDLSLPANRSDTLAGISGIDVIIDGHYHNELPNGLFVNDVLIANTGEHGKNIGIVEITVSEGVISKSARLIEVSGELDANEQILAKIAELNAANDGLINTIVGHTPVLLDGERENVRTGETNLANLITDSIRRATGADIAVFNGGGIRASIPAGDITMGHVLTVLPYSNLLVTMELSGTAILEALEYGVSAYPDPVGQHIQVSGICFEFDPDAEPGNRIRNVTTADGETFDLNRIYNFATIEYMAAGGDGYVMLTNGSNLVYYGADAEAFADYLGTAPNINAEAENRVRVFMEWEAEPEYDSNPYTGDESNSIIWIWLGGAWSFGLITAVSLQLYRKKPFLLK
ncbi:MAG: 5'-nucleotidase C-terminal domain-containing protein [Oscillospiraceae bacterium]|nr:5'-nucleotidase C-terminal domain-containing protein [Oscillospiraceae bacterium]